MGFVPLKEVKNANDDQILEVCSQNRRYASHTYDSADTRDSIASGRKHHKRKKDVNYKLRAQVSTKIQQRSLLLHPHSPQGTTTPDYYAHSVVVSYFHDGLFYETLAAVGIGKRSLPNLAGSDTLARWQKKIQW